MADHWQEVHGNPTEHMRSIGLEEAAYVAGWVLSCAAVLGAVLLVWHFNV